MTRPKAQKAPVPNLSKVKNPSSKYLTQSDGVGRSFIEACAKMVKKVQIGPDGTILKRASQGEMERSGPLVSQFLGKLICASNHSTHDLGKAWNNFQKFYPERAAHLCREVAGFVMMGRAAEEDLNEPGIKGKSMPFTAPITYAKDAMEKHIIPKLVMAVFNPQYAGGFPATVQGVRKMIRAPSGGKRKNVDEPSDNEADDTEHHVPFTRAAKRRREAELDAAEGAPGVMVEGALVVDDLEQVSFKPGEFPQCAGRPNGYWNDIIAEIRRIALVGYHGSFDTGVFFQFKPNGGIMINRWEKPGLNGEPCKSSSGEGLLVGELFLPVVAKKQPGDSGHEDMENQTGSDDADEAGGED